jgi:PTS system ascorbate-specific IIB component
MSKGLKIMAACTNGMSLMMKMSVEKAARDLAIQVEKIDHCTMEKGKNSAGQYDIAFVPLNHIDMFKDAQQSGTAVIGLRNVLSSEEIKIKLKSAGFAG